MPFDKVIAPYKGKEQFDALQSIFSKAGIQWNSGSSFIEMFYIDGLIFVDGNRMSYSGKEYLHKNKNNYADYAYVDVLAEETAKQKSTDSTNPKAAIGSASLPMTMLSPLANAVGALGKYNGKLKYGGANFIGTEVVMSIYLDAIRRHFDAIIMGEDADPVDNVPHWGAIMANIDIILCAKAAGTLIDDRLRADGQLEALRALKPIVASLQELHKEKNPKHYYLKNREIDSGN